MNEDRGRLVAINHVELETRPGIEAELRWFYGDLLGLVEIEPDGDPRRDVAVLRFRSERLELRISVVEDPLVATIDTRVQVEVPSLEVAAEQLESRRYRFEWIHGLGATDRALVLLDPIGHRVLVRRHWPPAPL